MRCWPAAPTQHQAGKTRPLFLPSPARDIADHAATVTTVDVMKESERDPWFSYFTHRLWVFYPCLTWPFIVGNSQDVPEICHFIK